MDLKTYINKLTPQELAEFAEKADTSIPYLRQLVRGERNAGVKSIFNFISASGGELTIDELRPDKASDR